MSQHIEIVSPPLPQPRQNHVDYIILAQFDIDKGSVIKHQYPKPTGVDEQYAVNQSINQLIIALTRHRL